MHLIRRSAFRAIASPSASFVSQSRTITTRSPFLLRSKPQFTLPTSFRRFASDDASTPSSADEHETSSIKSAIDSATESASTYASSAAESLTENYTVVKDKATDFAEATGAAAGFSAPRSNFERSPRENYGGDRNSGDRNGGGRGVRDGGFAPRVDVEPNPALYIGNLLFDITAQDLEKEFAQFGKISGVRMATDPRGLSKGFAYITFETTESATAAMQAKNQTVLEGRRMVVNYMSNQAPKKTFEPTSPAKTLFVGNLAFEMSDNDLNKLFRDIKNVIDVRVAIDRRSGQPRGFAHADFVDVESATAALEMLNGKELYGRALRVDYSAPPPSRRDFGRRDQDGGAPRGDRSERY